MLTNRDSRIEDLIEWLQVRRQTIDGVHVAADLRGLALEHRAFREALQALQNLRLEAGGEACETNAKSGS